MKMIMYDNGAPVMNRDLGGGLVGRNRKKKSAENLKKKSKKREKIIILLFLVSKLPF